MIRWIGVEVRIFAYFRNLTLISCFIGLGIGFNLKRFRVTPLFSMVLIAVLAAWVHPRAAIFGFSLRDIPQLLAFPDYNIWYAASTTTILKMAVGYSMVTGVVVIVAGIFIPFGQILGDIFAGSDNRIRDYSINILGSLLGTWAFAIVSYFNTPPWIWFIVSSGGIASLLRRQPRRMIIGLGALIPILFLTLEQDSPTKVSFWSPYQKIQLSKIIDVYQGVEIPYYNLEINSVTYMLILDLSRAQFERFPGVFSKADAPFYPYDLPYRFHPGPRSVLIVGAGGGNDTAAALRNGVQEVDAVEIDPLIARLGREYHPEKPYSDHRVRLIIDDARSFLKKTRKRYDMIVFALLDSHTLTSNFTNINLDSYVYTRECFEEAKDHLAQGGVISLSFFVQHDREWLGAKLFYLVSEVFGEPPLIINNFGRERVRGTGGILFITGGAEKINNYINSRPELGSALASKLISQEYFQRYKPGADIDTPTDDWPYLYLKKRQVPSLYSVLIVIMIALSALAIRFFFPGGRIGPSHFLFLGAGFMLVEVHSISKAALLFGSTWMVNAVIISAILVMILLANLLTLRYRFERMRWWYAGLLISLLFSYFVPVNELILGGWLVRGVIAGAFYSLPLFFAGIIFAGSIRRVLDVEGAFAANMLGATLGGMIESSSYVLGLKAVVLIALLLYAASALALRRMVIGVRA